MNNQNTIIKTIDAIIFTVLLTGKILFRISATTPIGIIIAIIALKSDPKTLSLFQETEPLQVILIGLQLTAPMMLILSPLYDITMSQVTNFKLTKIGWLCYATAWIIVFSITLRIPNII